MMVFSVAVAGLFPLLVILSRDLQPLERRAADGSVTYDCRTPARDGTDDRHRTWPTRSTPGI